MGILLRAICAMSFVVWPVVVRAETIVPSDYKLVWADEFDRDGAPDPAKWTFDTEHNHGGWFNHEKQYYSAARPENARVEGGHLVIEARSDPDAIANRTDYGGQQYSSARMMTRGLAAWRYGAVEVRAKLPCGVGTWPGIWMLPNDAAAKWPDGGEIDIMEHVGADPGKIHWGRRSPRLRA
jgi:beta-glucanase (GH16 family)